MQRRKFIGALLCAPLVPAVAVAAAPAAKPLVVRVEVDHALIAQARAMVLRLKEAEKTMHGCHEAVARMRDAVQVL